MLHGILTIYYYWDTNGFFFLKKCSQDGILHSCSQQAHTVDENQELAMLGHVSISLRLQRNDEATNSILTYFKMLKEMLVNISNFWSGCGNLIEILFHFSLFSPHHTPAWSFQIEWFSQGLSNDTKLNWFDEQPCEFFKIQLL